MKPLDFLVIGAQKSATSAVYNYLGQHPDIGISKTKELHFFDNEKYFLTNKVDYSILENQFIYHDSKKIYGECTPIYMYWEPACKRIWQYNKEIKLIVILRNPMERAYSHWNMELNKKKETLSFGEAIENENSRTKESLPFQHRVYSYIDRGFYAEQLRRLLRFFDRNQILFIKYECFRDNPSIIMDQVFNFLGVSASKIEINKNYVNKGVYNSRMSSKDFKYLRNIYVNNIREVENLLGWDCSDWIIQKTKLLKYEKYFTYWRSRFYRLTRS